MTQAVVDGKFMGSDPADEDSIYHEFHILSRLSHPNIVHLFGGCLRPPRIFLVEELMYGTLVAHIHGTRQRIPLKRAVKVG